MKRWIIRSFFIGLLLLCVGGWVASYWYAGRVRYEGYRPFVDVQSERGTNEIWFITSSDLDNGIWTPGRGFTFWAEKVDPSTRTGLILYDDIRFSSLGISLSTLSPRSHFGSAGQLLIPFWFPTLISAVLLWLVWRKTREKMEGRAFPVEIPAREKEP